MSRRLPIAALLLVLAALGGVQLTGATFTSTSATTLAVSAATDWEPPTVSVTSPGSVVSGTTTIAATAADSGTGVASVAIQYSVTDSGTWTTLCTDPTAPYSCSWATANVADGSYDLRAVATDRAGYASVSDSVTTRVANKLSVVLAPVADPARGAVTLRADVVNAGALVPLALYFQYSPAGSNSWTTVPGCAAGALVTTRTCTWNTTTTGDYDVRAIAAYGVGNLTDVQAGVTIDNTPPTITLTVPSGTLSGTVTLTATTVDDDSGMDTVTFQQRRAGTSTWTTVCSDDLAPWTCPVTTTTLADGSYDFQAVATDLAGNATTTTAQTRTVDNTVASASVTSPAAGATVRGTVTVTAAANSNRGVAKVVLEARATGTGTWTTLCTDTTAPYSCDWNTSAITTGSYDLRAVLTDAGGTVTTSAVVTVAIDNSVLRAQDVQVTNVTTAGKPANGDRLVLTYSGVVNLATIQAGWTGASTPLTVTFKDKAVNGGAVSGLDYLVLGSTNLGQLTFDQNYVKAKKSAAFAATMVASTATVAGTQVTVVTVTLGATTDGGNLRTASNVGTTAWYPTAAVRTPAGLACSTTPATESGASDKDF
jgi:hypothetical protein